MYRIIKIVSILALLSPFYAAAMEQPANNTQNSFLQSHSNIIQSIILKSGSADNIGQCARSLSQTNKHFYNTVQNVTPALIQEALFHTPTSEAQAALAIRTKAARPWLQKNLTDESFKELQHFLDEHLGKENPSQEEFAKIRFLIRSFPQIADCESCPSLIISARRIATVQNLLAAGVNVNQRDPYGNKEETLLMHACRVQNLTLVKLLLDAGANVSLVDIHGHDAFWYLNAPIAMHLGQGIIIETLAKKEIHNLLLEHQKKQSGCSIQ